MHFAHLTDIHINGTARNERLFTTAIEQINAIDDLDFVMITGDVLDMSTPEELGSFMSLLPTLEKPWHFIPGNHDGFIHPKVPDALTPSAVVEAIDSRIRVGAAQQAYWSREVGAETQLIGLDSTKVDHWSGVISTPQMAWLRAELDTQAEKRVLLAIHHPIHSFHLRSMGEHFSNFILGNCHQLEALLNEYPNVKLVMSGHHHVQQIRVRNGRLHLATGALTSYPCVYRTVRIREDDHITVETHTVAGEDDLDAAYQAAMESDTALIWEPGDRSAWPAFMQGTTEDWSFSGTVGS